MEHQIPEQSLGRIRQSYANFEQLVAIVAEAMGIDIRQPYRLDIQRGVLVLDSPVMPNGVAHPDDVAAAPAA